MFINSKFFIAMIEKLMQLSKYDDQLSLIIKKLDVVAQQNHITLSELMFIHFYTYDK